RAAFDLSGLRTALAEASYETVGGRLVQAVGPLLEAEIPGALLGSVWEVEPAVVCEVVGFRDRRALLMPLDTTDGVAFGARVRHVTDAIQVGVGIELLGRVLDGLGRPIDGKPAPMLAKKRKVTGDAPRPMDRHLITTPLPTGVRVLDGLITLGIGQRMAIMSGSGVGKSTLLGMIARNTKVDVNVICLVGERGREVREFLETNLGAAGLARSVLVIATSEQSPALQVKAPFLATTIAEAFRDAGMNVLLMVDSLTRLALAQRQIGLAAGEPPTTRGFTPSVFGLLPRLLERAGPGSSGTSITGLYTVLVEADDVNDPIGDAVRGIVDGHVVLSRRLASHNHFPAVDVLASLSRLMDRIVTPQHKAIAARCRDLLATWAENEELIRLGAYRKGSSPQVDEAIERMPLVNAFLKQRSEVSPFEDDLQALAKAVGAIR
ncbi:MAG: FliI/YscN family ATPase, partial [Myxococcota bacterium]